MKSLLILSLALLSSRSAFATFSDLQREETQRLIAEQQETRQFGPAILKRQIENSVLADCGAVVEAALQLDGDFAEVGKIEFTAANGRECEALTSYIHFVLPDPRQKQPSRLYLNYECAEKMRDGSIVYFHSCRSDRAKN